MKAGFVSREASYGAVDDYEHFGDTEDEVGDEGDEDEGDENEEDEQTIATTCLGLRRSWSVMAPTSTGSTNGAGSAVDSWMNQNAR